MTLADLTNEDILKAIRRALESLEGSNLYTPGPYPFTTKPLAEPATVLYWGADGKTYERAYTLEMEGDSVNAVLSDRREVESITIYVPVDGDVEPSFSEGDSYGGRTKKSGLIFRAGKYPDKGCEVTPDDLRQFVENFPEGGVQLMSEHEDSLIGDAMKEDGAVLIRVWTENADSELHGEVEYPNWLAYGLRKIKNSVSIGLDLAAKTIRELSLVKFPRVADAAIFQREAAIAFSKTPAFPTFRAAHPKQAEKIVTLANQATDPAPATKRTGQGKHPMNFKEKVKAGMSLLTPEQRAEVGLTDAELDNDANFASAPAVVDPRDKAFAKMRAERAFDDLLHDRKVTPAMKDSFVKLFVGALATDGGGTIKFSDAGDLTEGESVKALLETFGQMKPQFNVGERLPGANPDNTPADDSDALKEFSSAAKATSGRGDK